MDTHYNLLNALAEKLELHTGRDNTLRWNCVSGMNEAPGKSSQRVKDSAQRVESSFASRMCFTTPPETKLRMFEVPFVEVMWQLSLYTSTGWRGPADGMAPNSFTPSFPQTARL